MKYAIDKWKMPNVHPSAILEGPGLDISPDAIVDAFAYLRGPCVIGPGTRIWPHAVIGTEGEHKGCLSVGVIRIGARCVIREGVAVQRGTGEHDTTVGDDCFIMHGAHVAHDCVLEDGVTISPNVVLGGRTHVHRGATLGIGAAVHQLSTLGAFAMIGMGAVVTRDVPPFAIVAGNPARWMRENARGVMASGLDREGMAREEARWRAASRRRRLEVVP